MAAIEVWLVGGPADGRLQLVELVSGELPQVMPLLQAGVFVGSSDDPQPAVDHDYRRAPAYDTDEHPAYLHDPGHRPSPS